MNPRAGISILVCYISILSAYAQNERKDSLQQKKEGEIYINQEAVKSIEFYFLPQTEIMKLKPKMDESKPWMEFRKDLPMSLTDTTSLRKKKYIRMLPYSIWGIRRFTPTLPKRYTHHPHETESGKHQTSSRYGTWLSGGS